MNNFEDHQVDQDEPFISERPQSKTIFDDEIEEELVV
jgi:hypothetical protein